LDNVLTTGEASRLLGVTAQTVINWMESGRLPFVRVERGRRKVRPADLRALIEAAGIPAHKLDPDLWARVVGATRMPAPDIHPLMVLDSEGKVVFWSPAAVEKFGWTSEEVENRAVSLLPARVPGLPVDLSDLAVPGSGETFRTLLLELGTKSGKWLPTEVVVSWIHEAQGQPCGAIFVLQAPLVPLIPERRRRGRTRTL
jgi:excisionase family DNA binding protein/PAS domain S-box-containing protein